MIYLYAGLGMAMLLPILVGLQSAVYVAELEQGELAMQNSASTIATEWESNRTRKKEFRDKQIELLGPVPDGSKCDNISLFTQPVIDECAYHSEAKLDELYAARIYKSGAWKACLVPVSALTQKCPEEY